MATFDDLFPDVGRRRLDLPGVDDLVSSAAPAAVQAAAAQVAPAPEAKPPPGPITQQFLNQGTGASDDYDDPYASLFSDIAPWKPTQAGTALTSAGLGVFPAVTGGVGLGYGAAVGTTVGGPVGGVVGGIIGMALTGWGGAKAQDIARKALSPETQTKLGISDEQLAREGEAYPKTQFIAGLAPNLLLGRPGFGGYVPGASFTSNAARVVSNAASGGALNVGIGGAQNLAEGRPFFENAPTNFAVGTLFNTPTRAGQGLARVGENIAHGLGVPRPVVPGAPAGGEILTPAQRQLTYQGGDMPPAEPPYLREIPYQGPNDPGTIYGGAPADQPRLTFDDRARPPGTIYGEAPAEQPRLTYQPSGDIKPTDADLGRTADLSLDIPGQQPPAAAPAGPSIAFGDSLAVGAQRHAGLDGTEAPFKGGENQAGTARVGAPPDEVLRRINDAPDDQINGRDVTLSTGVSNDPSGIETVAQQISNLYARGARSVRVMGVGTRSDLAPLNDRLAEIANANNATFLGPLKHVGNDQVHSTDYQGELENAHASSAELLSPYTRPGSNAVVGGASGVENVAPFFSQRIADAVAAMPPEIRARFEITSGFRDQHREDQVYADQHPGQPVPQNSQHGKGLAVDIGNDPQVIAWIKANPQFGIGFPIDGLPGEQNHMEPIDANGNRIGGASIPRSQGGPADETGPGSVPTPREEMPGARFGEAVDYFVDKGLTRDQAIGIVARLHAESGLDPNNTNSIGATGIAQWYDRRPGMEAAGAKGDFRKQLDYIWHEFNTSEAAAFEKIKNAKTAADAARAMEDYERAGNPAFTESAASLAARISGGSAYPAAGYGSVVRGGVTGRGGGGGGAPLGGEPSPSLVGEPGIGAHPLGEAPGGASPAAAAVPPAAAADTQLARALEQVGALQPGTPVTNKRLAEIAGSGSRAEQTQLRDTLVQRGLITQKNGRYIRGDTVNQPDALTPTPHQAEPLPQQPQYRPPTPPAPLTEPRQAPVTPTPPQAAPYRAPEAAPAAPRAPAAPGYRAPETPPAAPSEPGWRAVGPNEVFQPGRQFRMNMTTGRQEVFEPGAATPTAHPELAQERANLPPGYSIEHNTKEGTFHLRDPSGKELEAFSMPDGMADTANSHAQAMGGGERPTQAEAAPAAEGGFQPKDLGPPSEPPRQSQINTGARTQAALEETLSRADATRNQPRLSKEQAAVAESARQEGARRFEEAAKKGGTGVTDWHNAARARAEGLYPAAPGKEPTASRVAQRRGFMDRVLGRDAGSDNKDYREGRRDANAWLAEHPQPDVGTVEVRVPHGRGGETVLTMPNDANVIRSVGERYAKLADHTLYQRPAAGDRTAYTGLTPEHIALRDHLYQLAKEIAPSLRFEVFRNLFEYSTGKKMPIHGRYDPPGNGLMEHIVKVALHGPDAIGALHHEVVHFFRNTGMFKRAEWDVLSKQADKWRERFDVDARYPGETVGVKREEAIAEAAAAWHRGELQAPPGIRRVFQRVQDFFHRVANYLRGQGYQNANDVFRRMRSGEIGRREPGTFDEAAARNKVAGRTEADLDRVLPVKDRRVGEYIPGHGTIATDHKAWADRDLSKLGNGAHFTQADIDRTFQNALDSVVKNAPPGERQAMQERIDQFRRDNPNFKPKPLAFWDTALKLPDRARYWYEISSEAFKHAARGINNQAQRLKQFFDVVAATSAQADPIDNLRRTIGIMAEERQGIPVQTDITSPTAVRRGLSEADLTGNKTGAFSRTFSHILGFDDKTPLSVNDRQVASSFGITGDDIMSHQWLHEALSKFYQDLRDEQNKGVRPGENPYETWQLQALGWVHERAVKDAEKGKVENYDDYAAVMKNLDQKLTEAGVDTSGGLLSDKVLMDPRTPNILSGTREQYVGARHATLETATTQTGEGRAAHNLNQRLSAIDEPWARKAQAGYEAIQRRAMNAIGGRAKGRASVIEDLMSALAGRKIGVSRVDTNGFGTFEGNVSPNMRIPLVGRTSGGGFFNFESPQMRPAREALLAALGKHLNQDASAASKFGVVEHGAANHETYSIFVPGTKEGEHIPKIASLEKELGYPLNVHEVPNGTVIDINVGGKDTRPTYEQVEAAADRHFGPETQIAARSYDSDYLTSHDYDGAINRFWGGDRGAQDQSGGVGQAGATAGDRGAWERATEALRLAASRRDADFQSWHDQYANRTDISEQRARQRAAADDAASGTHSAGVDDGTRFQRPRNVASDEERADLASISERDDRSLFEKSRDWMKAVRNDSDIWTKIKQNLLDRTAGLGAFERSVNNGSLLDAAVSPTKMAHLTANLSTVMSTIIGRQHGGEWHGGALRYNAKEGAFETIPGSKSLGEIFKPIFDAGLQDKWALWAIANRAKRLMAEGREHNVSQDIINKYQNLDQQHPEFRQAMADWRQLNKHILDMAEQTGLINAESRKLFENDDYVPFYRALKDDIGGPSSGGGLIANVRSGISKLTGGKEKVNDIYENMVQNLSSLVDRSMRNEAMNRLIKIGAGTESLTPMSVDAREALNTPEMRQRLEAMGLDPDKMSAEAKEAARNLFGALKSREGNVVSAMVNGKPQFFRVNNPQLLRSIAAMGPRETSAIMQVLGAPKRILTMGVTLDPSFMLRNVLRDSVHAWVVTGHGFTPGWDTMKGAIDAFRDSPSAMAIMAGGAGGAHFYDTSPPGVRRMLQSQGFQDSVLDTPRKILHFVERAGAASEMANRIAIYDNAIKSGASKAEAIWRAQDMMNFTMSGDNAAMKFLIQTVPFLNARMQGLARLGRGAYENPKSFMLRGSLIMAAAAALWLKNKDDPRYKALEDWDRQSYFHFFVGDQHFRLPQPFEVGALFAAVPEMMFNYWNNGRSRELGTAAAALLTNQLNLDPTRAAGIGPAFDVYSNKNALSGAPIVSAGEERLLPGQRYGPNTSPLLVGIGKAIGVSPDQLQYLVRGYTGSLGGYALTAADALARATGAAPSAPTMRADQMPLISSFVRSDPALGSRWLTEFYNLKQSVDQTVASVNALKKAGRFKEAGDLQRSNQELMALNQQTTAVSNDLAKIRQQMVQVQASNASPEQKRTQLDSLIAQRNRVAERVRPMIQRREHLSAAP